MTHNNPKWLRVRIDPDDTLDAIRAIRQEYAKQQKALPAAVFFLLTRLEKAVKKQYVPR
jgi:hypothetical protein